MPWKEDFQHSDDKIGPLREEINVLQQHFSCHFQSLWVTMCWQEKRNLDIQIALGAAIWGNQDIESCGVEQTNYFRF